MNLAFFGLSSFRTRIPGADLFTRVIRRTGVPGWAWVVVLWLVLAFPAIALRGAHLEEGTVVGLARGALEDGHWLEPFLYGWRFVERPVLLSWIAAGFGSMTGGVSIWSARIPHLLFLLAGALMVYHLVSRYARQRSAVFAALCWLVCPMVGQKFITSEPDVTLSVLLFAAFVVWWLGESLGRITPWRWFAIGILLALAGLTKGPQPLAYFGLAVGSYILLQRRWKDVPGFVAANAIAILPAALWYWSVRAPGDVNLWLHHSRLAEGMSGTYWLHDHGNFAVSLAVECLPGSLLLIPAILALIRRELPKDHNLILAALLYATLGSLALLLWPGGVATRYAMPGTLGLAVICGILFDRWQTTRPRMIAAATAIVTLISVALVTLGWLVMPIAPELFRQSRTNAEIIASVRAMAPGPVYVSNESANLNILIYVPAPVHRVTLEQMTNLTEPALAVITPAEVATLGRHFPAVHVVERARLKEKGGLLVTEITPARPPSAQGQIQESSLPLP
ncbi:MAG: glycosyltransferase family 39 protein [Alphaproteobacteria bacterium]|nr:glycosyltransferase family 39 protein [Alphaproteobacteria bacterium]